MDARRKLRSVCRTSLLVVVAGVAFYMLWLQFRPPADPEWVLNEGIHRLHYGMRRYWGTDAELALLKANIRWDELVLLYDTHEESALARKRLLMTLGVLGDRSALDALMRIACEGEIERQGTALGAIGSLGDERALPFLRDLAQTAPKVPVRSPRKWPPTRDAANAASVISGLEEQYLADEGDLRMTKCVSGREEVASLQRARDAYVLEGRRITYQVPGLGITITYRPDQLAIEDRRHKLLGEEVRNVDSPPPSSPNPLSDPMDNANDSSSGP